MTNKLQQLKKEMLNHWIAMERARFQLGSLGRTNSDGTITVDADRPDCVWVTLDTGNLIDAYNRGSGAVDKRAGLRVRVRMDSGRRIIDGLDPNGFSAGDTNAPGTVYSVNNVAPDSHGNVTLDSDDIAEGSTNLYTTAASVGAAIGGVTADDTVDDTDSFAYVTSSTLKKTAWSVIKSTLKTYFDTLYDKTATIIAALTGKTTPIDADGFVISDSAASGAPKLVTGTNLKAYMKTYWDTIYAPIAKGVTNGDSHDHNGGDGAQIPTGGIVDAAVTLAKMADLAQATVIGRASGAGTGVPTALSAAQVVAIINSTLDHGGLAGLSDDDHAQYLLLAGRSGGQTVNLNTTSGGNGTISSTIHATKGKILFGTSAYDEANNWLGIAKSPTVALDVLGQTTLRRSTAGMLLDIGTLTLTESSTTYSSGFYRFADDNVKFHLIGKTSGDSIFGGGVDSDTVRRLIIFADGTLQWGSGSASRDTNLYRNAANQLKTDDALAVTGVLSVGLDSVGASQLGVKAGSSSNDAAVGGVLYVTTTQVGNVGIGEDVLASYSVPANTLSANGMSLWFEASGTFANTSNAVQLRVRFGTSGTSLIVNRTETASGQAWMIRGRVIRTGSATEKGYAQVIVSGSTSSTVGVVTNLNQTLSGAVTLEVTGEGTANSDVVLETFIVGFDDANT